MERNAKRQGETVSFRFLCFLKQTLLISTCYYHPPVSSDKYVSRFKQPLHFFECGIKVVGAGGRAMPGCFRWILSTLQQ